MKMTLSQSMKIKSKQRDLLCVVKERKKNNQLFKCKNVKRMMKSKIKKKTKILRLPMKVVTSMIIIRSFID